MCPAELSLTKLWNGGHSGNAVTFLSKLNALNYIICSWNVFNCMYQQIQILKLLYKSWRQLAKARCNEGLPSVMAGTGVCVKTRVEFIIMSYLLHIYSSSWINADFFKH